MKSIPTLEQFVAVEGTRFEVRFPDITITLDLVSATPLPPNPQGPAVPATLRRIPYSLLFRGPRSTPLVQSTYRLTNDKLGEVDLFIVPMLEDGSEILYTVTVN